MRGDRGRDRVARPGLLKGAEKEKGMKRPYPPQSLHLFRTNRQQPTNENSRKNDYKKP